VVMGQRYNQLSIEEREMIAVLKAEGKSIRKIGQAIGRSHSTIVRELDRNSPPVHKGYYLATRADERARERKRKAGHRPRLKTPAIRSYVESKLLSDWSPEQIGGRLPIDRPGLSISHEAVYQYVYAEARDLIGFLARRHKKRHVKGRGRRHKKPHIPNRIGIDEPPRGRRQP